MKFVILVSLSLLTSGYSKDSNNEVPIEVADEVMNTYVDALDMLDDRIINYPCDEDDTNCMSIQNMLAPCDVKKGNPITIDGINCPVSYLYTHEGDGYVDNLEVNNTTLQSLLGLRSFDTSSHSKGFHDGSGYISDEIVIFDTLKYGLVHATRVDVVVRNDEMRDHSLFVDIKFESSDVFSLQRILKYKIVDGLYELIFKECQINKVIVNCKEIEGLSMTASEKVWLFTVDGGR